MVLRFVPCLAKKKQQQKFIYNFITHSAHKKYYKTLRREGKRNQINHRMAGIAKLNEKRYRLNVYKLTYHV